MKAVVKITKTFKVAAKPLFKKYPSLIDDLDKIEDLLVQNPKLGIPLGNNIYKIRVQIKSKGKGKSGGARVISYVETIVVIDDKDAEEETTVNLITIYDKSATDTIGDKEIKSLINSFNLSK